MNNKHSILLITAVFCFGNAISAQGESSAWTGCLDPGGTIIHMAPGASPLQRCARNQSLIHLRDVAAYQNTEANYDQVKFCEAFHSLSLAPSLLEDLGCPSTPTLTRPGTLVRLLNQGYLDNQILGNEYVCDIFGIDPSSRLGGSLAGSGFDFVVKNGFVASTSLHDFVGGGEACKAICESDDKCIAAWALSRDQNRSGAVTCRTFHYSDQIESDWGHYCGLAKNGLAGCAHRLSTAGVHWYVRVPNGQTVSNCLGATPLP
jgi:hypothetical protein